MSLRDAIVDEIRNAAQGTDLDDCSWWDPKTGESVPVIEETADRILALLRERLTSDAAVQSGINHIWNPHAGEVAEVREILTAALDAITEATS